MIVQLYLPIVLNFNNVLVKSRIFMYKLSLPASNLSHIHSNIPFNKNVAFWFLATPGVILYE